MLNRCVTISFVSISSSTGVSRIFAVVEDKTYSFLGRRETKSCMRCIGVSIQDWWSVPYDCLQIRYSGVQPVPSNIEVCIIVELVGKAVVRVPHSERCSGSCGSTRTSA